MIESAAQYLIVLQDIGDAVDTVSQVNPLLGAIVILLLAGIAALAAALIYVHKLYTTAQQSKEEQILRLNEFIRTSYKETTGAMSDLIHVVDVLTRTTETVSEDVKTEIRGFMTEIRTHISTIQNLPSFMRAQFKDRE